MGTKDQKNTFAAACLECRDIHVAVTRDDGEIRPMGTSGSCRKCGATTFQRIGYSESEPRPEKRVL